MNNKEKKSLNDLIIFCIYSLRKKCSFEELVEKCFSLFPEFLSFSKIKQWPDSRKLDRPLRGLRKKKLIIGSPKTLFFLTKLGKKRAEEVARTFQQRKLEL